MSLAEAVQEKELKSEFSAVELTPAQIVAELDKYVIAQDQAKKAVAIALRNRWRRLQVNSEMREEITPKNILMIGPTGVGKTEISRRLAKLSGAPFVKVEASKFTEVGYVGRDVDSIIRDLMEVAVNLVKAEERERVLGKANETTEEKLLDLLLPGSRGDHAEVESSSTSSQEEQSASVVYLHDKQGVLQAGAAQPGVTTNRTREKMREMLREGKLETRKVDVEITKQIHTQMQIVSPQGLGEIEGQIKDMFANMVPKQKETKKVTVEEARKILLHESQEELLDHDAIVRLALKKTQESGIVFIDEIDKICGTNANKSGPDVSREGVQRDLLPLVEGCTVSTKYGMLKTDHILFIASGAFHISKPSDLMPEFQGRFPIRVELKSLTPEHFERILKEPKNALIKQYMALLATEGVDLKFAPEAIKEIARLTAEVNSRTENIGARRLHTLLEKLLEDLSFEAHEKRDQEFVIDKAYVTLKLADIVQDIDLARFIL